MSLAGFLVPVPSGTSMHDLSTRPVWPRVDFSSVSVTQSSLALCDPRDCSSPGSSVHGILQARTLEWAAMSFIATSLNYHAPPVLRFVYLVLIRAHPIHAFVRTRIHGFREYVAWKDSAN